MSSRPGRAWERWAFAGAWIVMLAPVLAQALARPSLAALGLAPEAPALTLAAWLVALVVVLAERLEQPTRAARASSGVALVLAVALVGGSLPAMLVHALALACVLVGARVLLPRMIAALPERLEGLARARPGVTIGVASSLVIGVVQTGALAAFMADASWTAGAFVLAPELAHHSCVSAYVQGAEYARAGVENLYDATLWTDLEGGPIAEAAARRYAPFGLDAFAYPPVFLLFVRPLLWLPDFASQRALWFGLNAGCVAYGVWSIGAWVGQHEPLAGTRAVLLGTLLWISPLVTVTLQSGNVHVAMLALAGVAMVSFERGQPVRGGALLAAVILTKISPGLLGVVLLVRRQWRAAAWSAGFGLVWSIAALAVVGLAPFEAFVGYELPRLGSGQALAFFATRTADIIFNVAPFGVPFKLDALGLEVGDPWALGRRIAAVFSLLVIGLTIWAARRDESRAIQAAAWMAVLTLGALRSPFAPTYVNASALWLLCLSSTRLRGSKGAALFVIGYFATIGVPPMPDGPALITSMIEATLVLALVIAAIVQRPSA